MKKVIVFGAFDNLHEGHIHMLKEAKEYGDFLIAVVGRDEIVTQVKGKKPVYSEDERLAQVEKLNIADKVRLAAAGDDRYRTIAEEKPDIVALGFSQRAFVDELSDAVEEHVQIVRLQPYRSEEFNENLKSLE
jgi:cytidyltransferase-like protein